MSLIEIRGLRVAYGATPVLQGLDLDVEAGEMFFLLGPSGCGKTTLLRVLAGFIEDVAGTLRIAGRDMAGVPPQQRGVGLVFQSYALWPHMSVLENVAFGLEMHGVGQDERRARAERALDQVRLAGLGSRRPQELSGGQQQRVALARALVLEPAVVLLDEPLSNLDAGLRGEMLAFIRELQRGTGAAMIYVTHDRDEALMAADRIALLNGGRLVEQGAPRRLYHEPASRFAAEFLGAANFLPGKLMVTRPGPCVETCAGKWVGARISPEFAPGQEVLCCVRPESLEPLDVPNPALGNSVSGRLLETRYFGNREELLFEVAPGVIWKALRRGGAELLPSGSPMRWGFRTTDLILLSPA